MLSRVTAENVGDVFLRHTVVLAIYHLRRYSQGITSNEGVKVKRTPVASENLTYCHNLEIVQDRR